jgi:hypothetical protein
MRPQPRPAVPQLSEESRTGRFSAWLALAGVVVGAVFAGVPAYINNQETIRAASEASANEFLRQQRQAAFAQVISAENELYQFEQEAYLKFADEHPVVESQLGAPSIGDVIAGPDVAFRAREIEGQITPLVVKLDQSYSNLQIVASPSVVGAAREVVEEQAHIRAVIGISLDLVVLEPKEKARALLEARQLDKQGPDLLSVRVRIANAHNDEMSKFISSAKMDVGNK